MTHAHCMQNGTTIPLKPIFVTKTELWEIMGGKDGEKANSNGLESSGSQLDGEGGKEDDDQQK